MGARSRWEMVTEIRSIGQFYHFVLIFVYLFGCVGSQLQHSRSLYRGTSFVAAHRRSSCGIRAQLFQVM